MLLVLKKYQDAAPARAILFASNHDCLSEDDLLSDYIIEIYGHSDLKLFDCVEYEGETYVVHEVRVSMKARISNMLPMNSISVFAMKVSYLEEQLLGAKNPPKVPYNHKTNHL